MVFHYNPVKAHHTARLTTHNSRSVIRLLSRQFYCKTPRSILRPQNNSCVVASSPCRAAPQCVRHLCRCSPTKAHRAPHPSSPRPQPRPHFEWPHVVVRCLYFTSVCLLHYQTYKYLPQVVQLPCPPWTSRVGSQTLNEIPLAILLIDCS